ncbi:MAG: two-component regulator propeller domain-containing protein [Bacteroidota bacterium]|nr:two-component regulator propeller domain-containing protein [Bacteroidota bacterium]
MKGFKACQYLIFCLVFVGMCAGAVEAQVSDMGSDMRFKSVSSRLGLSSVFCMAQDENGFIWMGTRDGLNRFDGYDLMTFKYDPSNPNSISNNEITCIFADPNGLLWIGTRGGGVNLLDRRTNRIYRFLNISKENIVRNIFKSRNGTLWIGTSNGLVKVISDLHNQKFEFENVSVRGKFRSAYGTTINPRKTEISVVSINELSPDKLLIGTEQGFYTYNPKVKQFRSVDLGADYVTIVTSILVDAKQNVWLGTFEGLLKLVTKPGGRFDITSYNNHQRGERYIRSNRIESVVSDPFGNIWAGSRGAGLIKITGSGKTFVFQNDALDYQSLNDNIVNSLLVDRTGVLWIGTESHGCSMVDLYNKRFSHLRSIPNRFGSLGGSLVTAISGNLTNRVWVGTTEGGLDKLTFSKGTYKIDHFPSIKVTPTLSSNEIISLLEDRDHTLWIGTTANYITRYDERGGFKSYPSNGYVFSIYQDKANRIWFGTWGQGLGLIDKNSGQISRISNEMGNRHSLSSDMVLAIFDDDYGNLWVGTKGGGVNICPSNELARGNGNFISFKSQSLSEGSISHNDVYCITRDSRGIIWIGTGGGLNKVIPLNNQSIGEAVRKKNVSFKAYSEKDGLPNGVIYSVLEDRQGNLWLSTNNGLCVFDPRTEKVKNYFDNDGLLANQFHSNAYFKDAGGFMYFGGVNGLTYFNPDSIKNNPFAPQTQITGLKIFNQAIMPGDKHNGRIVLNTDIANAKEIILSYRDKELTFEFSAMHYANSQKIHYAYRLVGFNDKWQETKSNDRSVTYTNLDHGTYVLQVKATNNDGVWSEKPDELVITILPPFWQSPWFSIVYILLIAGGLYLFRKYSLIAVKEKNRLLIEQLEHKKQTEIAEAKMRFFTNISHEIRTPLTLIYDPLERVLAQGELDPNSRQHLTLMSKNVNRLLSLVNQLLQFQKIDMGFVSLKVSEVSLMPFLREVAGNFAQKISLKNVSLAIDTFSEQISLWFDSEFMTTVFYNLLSNAIKFTPEGGQISIKLTPYQGNFDVGFISGLRQRIFSSKVKEQNWIAIEIADTGKGISRREISRIFNRFYQVNEPSMYHHAGSGIGLSLVKEYVELHKGHIEVSSLPGAGSRFTVYLPVGKKHFRPDQIISKAKPRVSGEDYNIPDDETEMNGADETSMVGPEKSVEAPLLLIIEDDHELAAYLQNYFGETYQVITVFDGKKGMARAQESSPDLVISDVMLPGATGIEICNYLKSNIETSHIPVILLTAKAAEDDMISGYEGGADSYMTKPFNIKVLAAQVKSLIETRNQLKHSFSKKVVLKPSDLAITSLDEQFLQRLMDISNAHLSDNDFDVSGLVEAMNMSHTAILKKIKALTGLSLVDFIKSLRLKKAAQILQKEKYPIAEVGYMVGFSDPKYFSKCFIKEFGKTPTEYGNEFRN